MAIGLTRFWQGCSGGGWEKRSQVKSKNDASKNWAAEREEKNLKVRRNRNRRSWRYRGTLVRWIESQRRKCPVISLASCYAVLLSSKQGSSRWKKYFCLRIGGWSAKVTRLHWWSSMMLVWLKCRRRPAPAIQRKNDSVRDLFVLGF